MHRDLRLTTYQSLSEKLKSLGERAFTELLAGSLPAGVGIGGTNARASVAGQPIFIKRVRLTDLERRAGNQRSTRNLFELPLNWHYGMGSPGFGAWRELEAHLLTTQWVLSGECQAFPLLYHWRLNEDVDQRLESKYLKVLDEETRSPQSRELDGRLSALRRSSAELVLFLEHFSGDLRTGLGTDLSEDKDLFLLRALGPIREVLRFLQSRGVVHFDAHFGNILLEGQSLYLSDFGLACSDSFELSENERTFLAEHRDYDDTYFTAYVVNWLVRNRFGAARSDEIIAEVAAGNLAAIRGWIAEDLVSRYAPIAREMKAFLLSIGSSAPIPYPGKKLRELRS